MNENLMTLNLIFRFSSLLEARKLFSARRMAGDDKCFRWEKIVPGSRLSDVIGLPRRGRESNYEFSIKTDRSFCQGNSLAEGWWRTQTFCSKIFKYRNKLASFPSHLVLLLTAEDFLLLGRIFDPKNLQLNRVHRGWIKLCRENNARVIAFRDS